MSAPSIRALTLSQQAAYYPIGAWYDPSSYVAYPGPPFGLAYGAMRFQLHTSMRVDKPRTMALYMYLAVIKIGAPAVALGATYVGIQNSGSAPVFSNPGNLPVDPLIGLTGDWELCFQDDGTGWSAAAPPANIGFYLGTATVDPVQGTTTYDLSGYSTLLEHSDSNGYLNFSLRIYTANGTVSVAPILYTQEIAAFTGIEDDRFPTTRPVRCPKTGFPTHVGDLVEDGYRPGLWTTAGQWDPADPRDDNPVEMPDGEGPWDDDVPAH